MNTFKEVPASKKSLSLRRSIYGIGINDADYEIKLKIDGKVLVCPYYSAWASMLSRCYSIKYQHNQPTYKGCSVIKDWHLFSNFREWMVAQNWQGMALDKDILLIGNKIYSPSTCVFVSTAVNSLLVNNRAKRGDYPQGVSFHRLSGKYRTHCRVKAKQEYLGLFDTPEEASEVYKKAKYSEIMRIANTQPLKIRDGLYRHAELLIGAIITNEWDGKFHITKRSD